MLRAVPLGRRVGGQIARLPLFRQAIRRLPLKSRPALFFETHYNIGTGAFLCLFGLAAVVLKTILGGDATHLALLSAMYGGSSLASPLVSYVARWFPMKSLVVVPNFVVAVLLFATAFVSASPAWFAIIVGSAFVIRVFPRVGEMNMFRILYPNERRGSAVAWTKAVSSAVGAITTLLAYWWFAVYEQWYWMVFCTVGLILATAAYMYQQIPVSKKNIFAQSKPIPMYRAFVDGLKIFFTDREFIFYQFGFALAGSANHMSMVFIAEILREDVSGSDSTVRLVGAVIPSTMMVVAPLWGRFLDTANPMVARSVFNSFQGIAYALHAYGGLTLQVWPFIAGALLHGIGNAGGTINWLTGSLYFAKPEHISLYNAIHVCLTGVRGLLAPLLGMYLINSIGIGGGLFAISSVFSFLGAIVMLWQSRRWDRRISN